MVKPPTFDSNGMKKGAWSKEEDHILRSFVLEFGHHNWQRLPLLAGLARCGKSCRLRWMNYLKPGLKRGKITKQEEELIIKLHDQLGRKWSAIAAQLPGRTDNEIKNYWHTHIKKRARRGNAPLPEKESSSSSESSSRVTANLEEENVECMQSLTRDQDDVVSTGVGYGQTFLSQLDVDSGMFHEMQYDHTSTFMNSSDSGASFCNSSRADFWSEPFEEDTLEIVLW